MSIVINNLYEMLQLIESADTYDNTFDDGICWDFYDGSDDPCEICMEEVQKRIDVIKFINCSHGIDLIADISQFVKDNMDTLYRISQEHRESMESKDVNDDESVYCGVRLVNAMQAGYASDDEYLYLLHKMTPEIFDAWLKRKGEDWLEENEEYLDSMMPEVVRVIKDVWEVKKKGE